MTWAITADVRRFNEAAEWFRARLPVTQEMADELSSFSGPRAFTVAAVQELEVVQALFDEIQRSQDTGEAYGAFLKRLRKRIPDFVSERKAHTALVYRNAVTQSNNAGRWRQSRDPAVMAARPYTMFDAVMDDRTTDTCEAWNGVIMLTSLWPRQANPQLHHLCRSLLRTLRESQARARGITAIEDLPEEEPAEGFGAPPTDAERHPHASKYDPELFDAYRARRSEISRSTSRPRLDDDG